MNATTPLQAAIDQIGLTAVARTCGVSHQAVRKWQRQGRMPRTEWTGETAYAAAIEAATGGQLTKLQILSVWDQLDMGEQSLTLSPPAAPQEQTHAG